MDADLSRTSHVLFIFGVMCWEKELSYSAAQLEELVAADASIRDDDAIGVMFIMVASDLIVENIKGSSLGVISLQHATLKDELRSECEAVDVRVDFWVRL